MTAIAGGGTAGTGRVCAIRELGVREAWRILDAGFGAASVQELTGGGNAAYYLRLAALESVIAERMQVQAMISIHRALLSGVPVAEIAHVTGSAREHVGRSWRVWADGQRQLNTRYPGLGLGQHDYDQVAAAMDREAGGAEEPQPGLPFTQCGCPAAGTQIGSPRP